MTPNCWML